MRGEIEAETLLQIILVLVLVWLVLAILNQTLEIVGTILGWFPFSSLIGLIIAVLIVLWLLDQI
jgi:uncharacterized membrane protein YhdT